MSKEETIGTNRPEIKLTSTQKMVLKHMQKGLILCIQKKKEFLSPHYGVFKDLPDGTIEGMVKKKLVSVSPYFKTRYYLTDLGRTFKTN